MYIKNDISPLRRCKDISAYLYRTNRSLEAMDMIDEGLVRAGITLSLLGGKCKQEKESVIILP